MKGLVGLHCTTAHQWGAILLPYQLLTRSSCPWCWKNGLNTYIYIFFSNYFALQIYLLCVLIKKKKMMNKKKTFINALGEILFFFIQPHYLQSCINVLQTHWVWLSFCLCPIVTFNYISSLFLICCGLLSSSDTRASVCFEGARGVLISWYSLQPCD